MIVAGSITHAFPLSENYSCKQNSCSYENPHSCRSVNLYRYFRLRSQNQRSLLLNNWARPYWPAWQQDAYTFLQARSQLRKFRLLCFNEAAFTKHPRFGIWVARHDLKSCSNATQKSVRDTCNLSAGLALSSFVHSFNWPVVICCSTPWKTVVAARLLVLEDVLHIIFVYDFFGIDRYVVRYTL